MSSTLPNLRYTDSHEWVLDNGDGTVTIGITDHAQQALGDIVFIDLPQAGQTLSLKEEVGVIESVKAASDFYAPVAGEVVEVNETLEDAPEAVNESPYGDGWLMKVRLEDVAQLTALLDAKGYEAVAAD
ncbi:glycine cleavage system protein GcvH [Billgrantia azerbaijanica]|nr:glycine cleavage system protein GcvH [Halomonas azerbaijanica]